MTEAGWLAGTDPVALLEVVCAQASTRKLRLFVCACGRRSWDEMPPIAREVVQLAERVADDLIPREEAEQRIPLLHLARHHGVEMALLTDNLSRAILTGFRLEFAVLAPGLWGDYSTRIRDLFGNPFRPVAVDPAWLTPNVAVLALAAYSERLLPSGHLDNARLAVLSDALEEAGCTNDALLSHLRSPGTHVRGCWAIDLLLDKS